MNKVTAEAIIRATIDKPQTMSAISKKIALAHGVTTKGFGNSSISHYISSGKLHKQTTKDGKSLLGLTKAGRSYARENGILV